MRELNYSSHEALRQIVQIGKTLVFGKDISVFWHCVCVVVVVVVENKMCCQKTVLTENVQPAITIHKPSMIAVFKP